MGAAGRAARMAPRPYDEAAAPAAAAALAAVRDRDLDELSAAALRAVEAGGVTFAALQGDTSFHLDPVPRVIEAADWEPLEAGLAQRVRALDRFAADAYGAREIVAAGGGPGRGVESAGGREPAAPGGRPAGGAREIVAAGVVPERVIESAECREPSAQGVRPAGDAWVGIAGIDVVRAPDGTWLVVEDNLRTPSGIAYSVAARLLTLGLLEVGP